MKNLLVEEFKLQQCGGDVIGSGTICGGRAKIKNETIDTKTAKKQTYDNLQKFQKTLIKASVNGACSL